MATKIKGNMYCNNCKCRVAAVRNGHGLRNGFAFGGALATAGVSLLAHKAEKWLCPHCGGPAVHAALAGRPTPGERLMSKIENAGSDRT